MFWARMEKTENVLENCVVYDYMGIKNETLFFMFGFLNRSCFWKKKKKLIKQMKKKNESFSLAKVLGMDNWLNRGF